MNEPKQQTKAAPRIAGHEPSGVKVRAFFERKPNPTLCIGIGAYCVGELTVDGTHVIVALEEVKRVAGWDDVLIHVSRFTGIARLR